MRRRVIHTMDIMGLGHLDRLRRVRALLVTQGRFGAETAKLACYSGTGFTADLQRLAEADHDVVLVGFDDIYARQ